MMDAKRELLRHLVAALVFRAEIAVGGDVPADFAAFRITDSVRTPAEILAHMGDLLEGTLCLVKGEMVYLDSKPLASWSADVARFLAAARALDAFLASDAPLLGAPLEKIVQGPVSDALTHTGQILLLRRTFGLPVESAAYFTADIAAGNFDA